ncbi:EAL domain-containing protein [Bradyrhizobium sp. AUGA SZCCT0176]|uniref:EAL domain-containing protein n=1 Tax=Bradyrhizobium sp. AUGA SZCCT0176 TaxID=2807664 RepID=UPI0028A24F81|nr:EAL domain-containing protein [Bradyrhizobium sp. AUGA SZCCT0176]
MSIRYKFFGVFSVVIAIACALALYGMCSISVMGNYVIRLYDGPLQAVNHARSAHAELNEARRLMQFSLVDRMPRDSGAKFERILASIADELEVVRERVDDGNVRLALQRAESRLRDWSETEMSILRPPSGGLTMVPTAFSIRQKEDAAAAALDDLVETVAAYGFKLRMAAEASVASTTANMFALATSVTFISLIVAAVFAYSMTKPISAAMQVAGRVAAGNFVDRIEVRRRDELGQLLRSLAVMQARLETRSDEDHALMASKERLTRMLAALSATNEAIVRAKTRTELFELTCEAAANGAQFTCATIALAEPGSDFLRVVAASGPRAKAARALKVAVSPAYPEGRGLTGTAFRTKQACISNNYLADQERGAFHDIVRRAGSKSGAALPLLSRGHAAGVLLFMAAEEGIFTSEFVELLERMATNISFALENFDRADEKAMAEERIEHLATHDGLTDLPNRTMFSQLLNHSVKVAERQQRPFALLFIDLDRFKIINDSLGHEAGDALLVEMAKRLRGGLRANDVVARLGGDEFVILLNEVAEQQHAATVAHHLLSIISEPLELGGHECRVTASIGVAIFPKDGNDERDLMKNADSAMYLAKQEGKNHVRHFSNEIKTQSVDRLMMEAGLRRALDRNELCLHYQPKLDIAAGRVVGVEALLRWMHPDFGLLPPLRFIPLAEETGLIVPIGRWIMRTACAQNVAWQREGLPPISMAINVSPRQFCDENLLRDIDDALAASGMEPQLLQIEVTESMVMLNIERAVHLLESIRSRGVRLAIDDFGTGYSSMSAMKRFPIDTIKIDRSFVRELPHNPEDRAIARAIINMGKALGLTIVAEGVETIEQMEFLREQACDEIQGFLISKPVPPENVTAQLLLPTLASPNLQMQCTDSSVIQELAPFKPALSSSRIS